MNILFVVFGVAVALVVVVVAVVILRPDWLRLEQIQPIGSAAILAELRARVRAFAAIGFEELAEMPEHADDRLEIEGAEVSFCTRRSLIDDDTLRLAVEAEIKLGGTEHQPHVGAACCGFNKTRDEEVEPLGADDLGPYAVDLGGEVEKPTELRAEFDRVSPPGAQSEQQRPIRIVEWVRFGPLRFASPCEMARREWTAGMDDLEGQIARFAERVGCIEESRLSPEDLNEQIDVLGRRGAIFAQVDLESGDRPRVIIAALAPIARWPLGRWLMLAAYARNTDGSSSWLWSSELSDYW